MQRLRILGHFREIKDKAFRAIEAGEDWMRDIDSSTCILKLSSNVIRFLAAEAADNQQYAWGQERLVLFRTAWDVTGGESEGSM